MRLTRCLGFFLAALFVAPFGNGRARAVTVAACWRAASAPTASLRRSEPTASGTRSWSWEI